MAEKIFKRLLLVLFCSLCASAGYGGPADLFEPIIPPNQGTPQTLFDQANDELENSNYQEAIAMYQQLEQQEMVSGAVFLNLGLAYQRLDSLGKAKYYFLKASRFEGTSGKADNALELLESQFSRQSAVLPQLPWDRATNWLQYRIGASTLLAIGIILLNIGILIFAAHWFVQRYSSFLFSGGLVIIGLSAVVIAASFYTEYVSGRYSTAVMVTEQEAVRETPGEEASLISQAFEGYAFTVDHYRSEARPGWSYVRMSNGLYGWIPESDIKVL